MTIRTVKRLVEISSGYGGGGREVDMVKLRRVAKEFKAWLLTIDPNDDPFYFLEKDLPLVEAALNGTMKLPFIGNDPQGRLLTEGLLPREYSEISAPFYVTIRGSNLIFDRDADGNETGLTTIEKDGKRYAWAEFELPEDENESA